MNNFELFNPTHLVFGKGQMSKLKDLIPPNQKVLMVYGGGSIFKNGVYDQVKNALKDVEVLEFGGVEPNPKFETLMKAVEVIKNEKIQFILAVGGGSVIDGVKFLSAASCYEGPAEDILKKRIIFKQGSNVMPFGTVLTLPATGSEMNSGAVITIEATHEKLDFGGAAMFPKFSICDPTVIASLPERQLQNGVIDAFVHVLEQYITYKHDAFLQDRFAESILQTLIEIGPKIVQNPSDYTLASNYMWCCTMALNGLLQKGVPSDWATHMIGHELTALFDIDHARTLAIIGPNLYLEMFETKKEKLAQYGTRVFGLEGTTEQVALEAIEKTKAFYQLMGMKIKLSENTTDYEKTADFIVKRFEQRGWVAMGERQNITLEKVKNIVERAY
ncbi:NADH-dependent alcohol dehydrogenase [Flavobacterium branchiophilum NBRC 15030 = ATCC 35035]|uniref:NADP-dependent alcohol dehydrogenase n=1 Tax=Flavobacterium branchiophilum TaxID=55197 RepID=A0A543G060_9FLAO|nr:iron-containing alcohol dehydrogenase [Flavobacterium branchiophilum]OXA74670.1 NADH-dependent alcohol dehydrogenase [Flavobacterium branchiophilum NBRC 15030 = ATCC 35035]TQM39445.1 NADP-dependent alcohol dehydrogenase [Flavobacterium branchiophilum]GEM55938.1 NADH-dependent alcohol dehydrogenase [Flavobacterium branchiophilum NBRC 15030 = ATCC 35035]